MLIRRPDDVKADLRPPLVYAGILARLLGYRLWFHRSTAR